jgi:hypothetical protein
MGWGLGDLRIYLVKLVDSLQVYHFCSKVPPILPNTISSHLLVGQGQALENTNNRPTPTLPSSDSHLHFVSIFAVDIDIQIPIIFTSLAW